MALKECKECGNDVSTKAVSCPKCGAVLKKKTSGCAGCLGVILFGLVVLAITNAPCDSGRLAGPSGGAAKSETKPKREAQPKTEEQLHKERISRSFSAWDGSHRGLTKVIKASMNDPDSYDHVETVCWDMGDHLVVRTTFRGKNAFGGVVKNWVKATVDLDGNVLAITEQGP